MNTRWLVSIGAASLAMLVPAGAGAQDVRERIESLTKENAILYAKPLTSGLGVAMNQGVFHTAAVHGLLGFHVGVAFTGAALTDDDDLFKPVLPKQVSYRGLTFTDPYGSPDAAGLSPTVTGSGSGRVFEPQGAYRAALLAAAQNPSNFRLHMPDGFGDDFGVDFVPMVVIQAGVGLILGTEVSVRLLPEIEIPAVGEDVGKISATGFGIKHSLSQYIPLFPIDVAAHFGKLSLDVGDYVEASSTTYGLIASKGLGVLTLYGAGGRESADVDVEYVLDNPTNDPGLPPDKTRIAFTDELDGETRFTVGGTLNLALLKLSADYSFADRNAFSAKALFSFR